VARLNDRVPDWLRQRAQVTPARLALIVSPARWTFEELDTRVDAAAAALRELGVTPGRRVGLKGTNSAGFVVAVFALMRLGAVSVPLNIRLSQPELDWQTTDAELQLVLDDAALDDLLGASPSGPILRDFALAEPHSVIYTSGTTGRPKGAILTYGNHWWSAVASALNLGIAADDRWLACLPLFHVGGLSILLRGVACGMTVVVHPRFDAAAVNAALAEERVTIVSVVATTLDRMLTARGAEPFPKHLRCVLLGGGPAPLPLLERALAARAPVVQTYGLTETASQVVTLAPEDAIRKLGSAGKPLLGTRLRLADDGEICLAGPTVSPGYLHHPARRGWLRTGDLGRLDEDGFLYVLDRRADLVISGGENVYPAEVEAVLAEHPDVGEAGVFGVADPEWGQVVHAAVSPRPGAVIDEAGLLTFCRARLAAYKVPRRIEVRPELPRTAAGKLLRRTLRDAAIAG
jgi:O-succinylbenzoic acid--CoA ligase